MRGRTLLTPGLLLAAGALLAGCSGPSGPVASPDPTASRTPQPTATATLSPEVAAAQGRFDQANQALAASNDAADDRAIVDALVGAGFSKTDMQITPDTTTIGRRVDSIEVSVKVDDTCLVGQFRGATYVGQASPALSTGRCLLGTTRAIDW